MTLGVEERSVVYTLQVSSIPYGNSNSILSSSNISVKSALLGQGQSAEHALLGICSCETDQVQALFHASFPCTQILSESLLGHF